MTQSRRDPLFLVHATAAALSLGLAWWLSGTHLVQTGVQFVAPAAIILAVHLAWLSLSGRLAPGFFSMAFSRSLGSAVGLAGLLFLGSLVLPTPAEANAGEVATVIFTVLFCVVVLLLVGGALFAAGLVLAGALRAVVSAIRGKKKNKDSRLFDLGAVAVAATAMTATALEGLPQTYSFPKGDRATATVEIAAPPSRVWQVMERATAPSVPLPAILGAFPKPVDVAVDEGTALGARREILFSGREGAGRLALEVTDRAEDRAHFTVLSDTSPYAQWISFRGLTYLVEAVPGGTRLSVEIAYDRDLSPAWFFGPMMRGAGYFAAGVLAGDVKERSEG